MPQVFAGMDQRMAPGDVAAYARRVEALGYDGLNVPDSVHDGLLTAQIALLATERIRVATSVLVVFPRSPMTVAHGSWDLQALSGGRFELGLGSQVRGNIVGRFSTPWTPPVPRMREYIGALRAIFDTWQNGAPLSFEGEHYRFTRMQPFFDPGPLDAGPPPIQLGAIGPAMTALAGEAADGLVTHPTNGNPRYLREVVVPRIARGAERSGRAISDVGLEAAGLVATGSDDAAVTAARESIRELLGFLYSTPAYWPSLELYGWKDRGERLHALTREGKWSEMTAVIGDDMLDAFVPTARYDEIAETMLDWYGDLATRVTFPVPGDRAHDDAARAAIAALRGAG